MNSTLCKHRIKASLFTGLVLGSILFTASCGGAQPEPILSPVVTRPPSILPTSQPRNKSEANNNLGDVELYTEVYISPTVTSVSTKIPYSTTATPIDADRMTETLTSTSDEVNVELLNDISADFIYVADGNLYLFDHRTTGKIPLLSPLLENSQAETNFSRDCSSLYIAEIVIDDLNKIAATLVDKGISANGIEQYQICVFKFESGEAYTLIDNIPQPSDLDISPDGKWITYVDTSQSMEMVILSSEQREIEQTLTVCSGDGCNGKIWSPDSRFFLWTSKSGIWLYDVESGEQENIQSSYVKVSNQSGGEIDLPVIYQPIAWSPSGRYGSVEIHPERSDIEWVGLLDTKTGRMVEVPDTHSYPEDNAVHTWNDDGTLTTVRYMIEDEVEFFETTTYEIVPTHTDLMIAKGRKTFSIPEMITGSDNSKSISLQLYNLHQQTSGTFSLLLATNSLTSNSWLVELDDHEQFIKVIAEIPRDTMDALWSPDGKYVIILGRHGEHLLIMDTQDTLYDLRVFLGDDLTETHWLSAVVQVEQ